MRRLATPIRSANLVILSRSGSGVLPTTQLAGIESEPDTAATIAIFGEPSRLDRCKHYLDGWRSLRGGSRPAPRLVATS